MRILTKLADLIGWKTCYWIGYQYPVSGGLFSGDLSMTVRPWITRENMGEVRDEVKFVTGAPCCPNITFVTRIRLS